MSQCAELSTPLDRLMLLSRGNHTFHLATPYSTPDAEENGDKCLTVDCKYNNLAFDRCPENGTMFEWSFIKNSLDDQSFLLFHPSTQKCVNINQTSGILQNAECDFDQSSMKWKFFERHPTNVFLAAPKFKIKMHSTVDNSALLAFLSQNSDKSKSPSSNSSDKFGLGIVVGFLLACVVVLAIFASRYIFKFVQVRLSRNGYPTKSAVYHQEQNVTLLEN